MFSESIKNCPYELRLTCNNKVWYNLIYSKTIFKIWDRIKISSQFVIENLKTKDRFLSLFQIDFYTVKAFFNPLNDKKFHNFQRGLRQRLFFIAGKILFVCILIYFNKNIHFQWITKKCKNYKIKFSLKYKFY